MDRYLTHNSVSRPIFVTVGNAYSFAQRRLLVDNSLAAETDLVGASVSPVAGWVGADVPPAVLQRLANVETAIKYPVLLFQPAAELDNTTSAGLAKGVPKLQVHTGTGQNGWMRDPKDFVETTLRWLHERFPVAAVNAGEL
jgi:hypothetical protein